MEVIAAVVNTSPVKAVYERADAIAYAIEKELQARGMLASEPPAKGDDTPSLIT